MTMTLAEARNALGKRVAEAEAVLALKDIMEAAAAAVSAQANAEQHIEALKQELVNLEANRDAAVKATDEAKAQAQTIIEQARVDAKALTDKAAQDAKAATDAAKQQTDAANTMLANLGAQHADLTKKVDDAKVQLGELQTKLAAAEEARRKILGGE